MNKNQSSISAATFEAVSIELTDDECEAVQIALAVRMDELERRAQFWRERDEPVDAVRVECELEAIRSAHYSLCIAPGRVVGSLRAAIEAESKVTS